MALCTAYEAWERLWCVLLPDRETTGNLPCRCGSNNFLLPDLFWFYFFIGTSSAGVSRLHAFPVARHEITQALLFWDSRYVGIGRVDISSSRRHRTAI